MKPPHPGMIKLKSWSVRGRKFRAEGTMPSPSHKVVVWFEEDPGHNSIDVFLELRHPITVRTVAGKSATTPSGFVVEKKLDRMIPGEYMLARLFVQGKPFGKKKARINQK